MWNAPPETSYREIPIEMQKISPNPINVLVVDDHPVVREGLGAMISAEPDMVVVGEAGSGAAAVELYSKLRPTG